MTVGKGRKPYRSPAVPKVVALVADAANDPGYVNPTADGTTNYSSAPN